ncbi:MAG: DUF624 domain-containing protein [Ruminococcus sp.]|nr:DUF624 domain-containing protein [Ruminococcus sp.]
MGIIFKDYESSGPGIAKNAPQKKGAALFFELLFRNISTITSVNLLYFIFFLPLVAIVAAISFIKNYTVVMVVTGVMLAAFAVLIGPATAAVANIMRKLYLRRHTFVVRDFFRAFRDGFKKASAIGILGILVALSAGASLYVYPQFAIQSGNKMWYVPMVITLSLAIVAAMMNFYIYLMLTATDLSLKDLLKNSFSLAFIAMKTNLLTLLITAVIAVLMFLLFLYFEYICVILLPFIPAAIMWFVITFCCYPVIQKYVIDPYYTSLGEVNPEHMSAAELSDEETLFEDMGGKEKPIEKRKKGKGKRIS